MKNFFLVPLSNLFVINHLQFLLNGQFLIFYLKLNLIQQLFKQHVMNYIFHHIVYPFLFINSN
jgi:hypothetical protein